ncbi:squalene synthase [Malassezia vespertilionis]|uniref:Squalene synthase n=1 Tax=Malassezia vespertilionis TaxID=2020962 RepID=A0A2N1JFC8_9BASI|nr:squalene synthase [Malassezia vespertilionis]PKI85226.1 Erg9p [Malassezia vespertilionis]WFD06116.1 squalene synthase [Malassezia vespertilionis]
MGVGTWVKTAIFYPDEFRAIFAYTIWRDPVHDFKRNPAESGYDRERMRQCWQFLDMTSRSFAAVIKELKGELCRVICIFYLVLRALDTVEDDMTLPPKKKIPLLIDFHKKLYEPGWTFSESGPNEKDRQLLVQFDKVIDEYQLLSEGCKAVISDICARMGAGMASYIELGDSPVGLTMQSWTDYDLYCHFVAGLVGEGLSGLFAQTGIESPMVAAQLSLSNHMGLFLQKTNIIRDYAEDVNESRSFWPKECWGANGIFKHENEVQLGVVETKKGSGKYKWADTPEGKEARVIMSTILLDALSHAVHVLEYMLLLHDQSVFNFCATPQVMAIATLELMLDNPDVLKKNVKIRKSLAVSLILRAVNPRDVAYTFVEYARFMHKKIRADDPNYVRWCVELGRIEAWAEGKFPSYVRTSKKQDIFDVRVAMYEKWAASRAEKVEHYQVENSLRRKLEIANPAATRSETKMIMLITFGVTIFMMFFLVIFGVLSWFVFWYTFAEGTDPLTLFVRALWKVASETLKTHRFNTGFWDQWGTLKYVFNEAGDIVSYQMQNRVSS